MKKNKRNSHRYVILFCIVVVLAVLALSLDYSGSFAAAMTYDKSPLDEFHYRCIDSDPINSFFVKGSVQNKKYEYYDFCSQGKLFQTYCKTSTRVSLTRGHTCPKGCVDGACIK